MKITWIGHSCFMIEKNGYRLVIDPYTNGSVRGYAPVSARADKVLCTHEHGDHSGRDEVKLIHNEKIEIPFQIEVLETYHDEVQGKKRGKNKIYVITDGKYRIAHFGDLGCELTSEQMSRLQRLDVALVPVGGYYTIDGKQAAVLMKKLNPDIIIPMHFRDDQRESGFQEIDTVETFANEMDRVIRPCTSTIDPEEERGAQVIILQPMR